MKNINFLASANTCNGFENHFDSIFSNEKSFTYILKGGPGTGKSTFMKKLADIYEKKGFCVERYFCSSDPQSLDGVRIVEKNICIVDGTSPHTTECSIPGVREVILNLGSAIKENIKSKKRTIEYLLAQKSKCFEIAYGYLMTAGKLIETSKIMAKSKNFLLENKKSKKYTNNLNKKKKDDIINKQVDVINAQEEANKLVKSLQLNSGNFGKRQLFFSYFTANGVKRVENNIKRIIKLPYSFFDGVEVLRQLSALCEQKGVELIEILSPICCGELEGIYLPQSDSYITLDEESYKRIPNYTEILNLLKKGGKYIDKARSVHLKIEQYYVKNMDFDLINRMFDEVNSKIELA